MKEGALKGSWGVPELFSKRPIFHENHYFYEWIPFMMSCANEGGGGPGKWFSVEFKWGREIKKLSLKQWQNLEWCGPLVKVCIAVYSTFNTKEEEKYLLLLLHWLYFDKAMYKSGDRKTIYWLNLLEGTSSKKWFYIIERGGGLSRKGICVTRGGGKFSHSMISVMCSPSNWIK